jgi:hypothetical protein
LFSSRAYGNNLPGFLINGNDAWLRNDNALAAQVDKRIGCAEVNAYVV